ncbi:MAG: leucine-rich repeat domain-containing protein [Polyangiaceae bacterium]
MKSIHASLAALGLVFALNACDDPPKPEEKPAASAAPVAPPPAPAPTPSAAPVAAATTPPKKTLAECGKGPNAEFDQPGLEAEIRKKLQKPDGAISLADLKKVRSVNLSQAPRTAALDVCTFSHLTALKDVFLPPGDYDDISVLAGLSDLESISAAHNNVKDVSSLSKLKKLDRLDLAHTQVTDVTPIAQLTTLTELTLDDTPITDISPLAKLTKLEKLGIQHTQVKDASSLKALKKLKVLYAAGTPADEDGVTLAPIKGNGTKVID